MRLSPLYHEIASCDVHPGEEWGEEKTRLVGITSWEPGTDPRVIRLRRQQTLEHMVELAAGRQMLNWRYETELR